MSAIITILLLLKARDTTPCWSYAKYCLVGNCKDIYESVGNEKKR